MKEFKINNYITLKLEADKTIIYVKGKRFNQCKYILVRKKVDELEDLLEIESVDELAEESIDEIAENLDHTLEGIDEEEIERIEPEVLERIEPEVIDIPPETKFWVHCSNIQIWTENNYDTRLLHSNLAFPLLKELVEAGDPKAKMIFSEEIAKRIEHQYFPVIQYLINEDYLTYLDDTQFITLLDLAYINIPQLIEKYYELELSHIRSFKIYKLFDRIKELPIKIYHRILMHLYKKNHITTIIYLNEKNYDQEIKRENYYYYILEEEDANTMLKLENILNQSFWLNYDVYDDIEMGIAIENRKVIEMSICKSEVKEFPRPILRLQKLRKLIFYCDIKHIPRDISRLKNLEELYLVENRIEILPETIGNIRSLKVLDIRGNPIRNIPTTLKKLVNLKIKLKY